MHAVARVSRGTSSSGVSPGFKALPIKRGSNFLYKFISMETWRDGRQTKPLKMRAFEKSQSLASREGLFGQASRLVFLIKFCSTINSVMIIYKAINYFI